MVIAERIAGAGPALTGTERRVAEEVLRSPQGVAFGTVAELAERSGAGVASVARLAAKLGYDGFSGLQTAVQAEVAAALGPAADRIRTVDVDEPSQAHEASEVANVEASLAANPSELVETVVDRLVAEDHPVLVAAGDAVSGVAAQFTADLAALRPGVASLSGNEVAVTRSLAAAGPESTLVAVDVARYDRWLLAATETASELGVTVVAVTDGVLSPLVALADHTLTVAVDSVTPFESHVGTLALLNRLVLGVADGLREPAAERLGRTEAAWRRRGALVDR